MTIEERIQRLEDVEAIRYLQAKYQRCLDCRDFDGINECFASDVVSSYGNGEMAYTGAENVIAFLKGVMAIDMPSAHMIHGGEIDILSSTTASAKWYLQDFLINKAHSINIHGAAIYENTYEKIDGYKRMYEYYDMISQTQSATLKKTTFLDELQAKQDK